MGPKESRSLRTLLEGWRMILIAPLNHRYGGREPRVDPAYRADRPLFAPFFAFLSRERLDITSRSNGRCWFSPDDCCAALGFACLRRAAARAPSAIVASSSGSSSA